MKITRFIKISVLSIVLFFVSYSVLSLVLYNRLLKNKEAESISFYETDPVLLVVKYTAPKMCFGSGHKKMYLFARNHLLLGSCTFGEFPMEIKCINTKEKSISIVIKDFHYDSNKVYIESWIQKNKKIGGYKIIYE